MSKGLLCHLGSVNDLNNEIPSIDSVPIVNEFLEAFPEDFPGVPPPREIDYGVELYSDTNQSQFLIDKAFILQSISLGALQCCL